ncbi:hypothetical protein D3C81_201770 [compost metagenome]
MMRSIPNRQPHPEPEDSIPFQGAVFYIGWEITGKLEEQVQAAVYVKAADQAFSCVRSRPEVPPDDRRAGCERS